MSKSLSIKTIVAAAIVGIVALSAMLFIGATAYASITTRYKYDENQGYVENYSFFNATSTSATSTNKVDPNDTGYFKIVGAKKVEVYVKRGGVTHANTGSSLFTVQVTPDGINWYPYARLQIASTTASNSLVSSITLGAATTTELLGMDLFYHSFYGMRCIAAITTDGENTCSAYAEF